MRLFQVSCDRGIPPDGSKGASVHLRCLARALADEGHDVTTFCTRAPLGDSAFPVPLMKLDGLDDLLREAEHQGPPDVVYERYALGQRLGLRFARDQLRPLILEVNAPLVHETRRFRPHRLGDQDPETERELFREADMVVAVSEPLRRYVAEVRGSDAGTFVIPNGCEPDLYPESGTPGPPARPVLVFLGNPKPWHGADVLPRLVEDIVARGQDVTCLIIGGGEGADAICDLADAHGVRERFQVTGEVAHEQAAEFLATGTMLLAPYPAEEFFYFCPLKIIEGMAAGIPVVSVEQGDIPDLLGGTGVVVPPGNYESFLGGIIELLGDEARRIELSAASRRRARASLTWRSHARTLVDLIAARHPEVTR